MKVLVTAASKHGGTAEIAERIGRVLRGRGLDVDVCPVEENPTVGDYDAVVLGSAVYLGRWLGSAVEFAVDHQSALAARPVWLFSSGPVGHLRSPAPATVHVDDLEQRTKARGHRLFGGRIDRHLLQPAERAVVTALGAPEGDYRDWGTIEAWATNIAGELGALGSGQRPDS